MLDSITFRNFAFEGIDINILKVYAKNVIDSLILGLKGQKENVISLFDFESMKDDKGNSLNVLFAMYGMDCFKREIGVSGSDIKNVNTAQRYWSKLGKLQSVCVAYSEVRDVGVVKTLCIGNSVLFKLMVIRKLFGDIDVTDKKVTTSINRLTVPKEKKFNDKKSRNVYADILLGNDKGIHSFCGPKIEFGDSRGNNIEVSFSNSSGMNVDDTLFVPVAFLYLISDIFKALMYQGEYCNGAVNISNNNEAEVLKFALDYLFSILGNTRIPALKLYTLNNKVGLVKELASGQSIKGWGTRSVYRAIKGVTLSENVVRQIYGTKKRGTNIKLENKYSKAKILEGKDRLGFVIPDIDIFFYDTESERESVKLAAIDIYNFAYAMIYTNTDMITSEKVREKVRKYPRLVMLMVYLDYIDSIFEKRINGLDKLWYLVSLKDELKDKIYSDDHYNFMNNAAQYYRATDIYTIVSDPELSAIFYDFDNKCREKAALLGINGETEDIMLPAVDKSLSEERIIGVRLARKQIIEKALKSGICVVDCKLKGKDVSRRYYLTYDKDIIKRVFGDNYIGLYGSITYRLKELEYRVENAKSINDLNKALGDLAVMEIMGKEIEVSKGKFVTCDIIAMSADFNTYKQAIITFIQNMNIKMGARVGESATVKEEVNKSICTVNLTATKRSCLMNKNGSTTFNRWLLESSVEKISLLK